MAKPVKINVASFFSGCGGLDLGFKKAGYNIVLASDFWEASAETYKLNNPETEFILEDIRKINKNMLSSALKRKGIKKIHVLLGGPPCQCFTRLNNNNLRKDDERNQLFKHYIRMVNILKPDFVVMENVADLLVRKDEKGRYFKDLICKEFEKLDYQVKYKVFETEKFGVPQKRRRVIFLATRRKDIELSFPKPSNKIATVGSFLKKLKGKKNLENHEITKNEPHVLERIKHVPPGGYYEHLPEHLKTKKFRNGKWVIVKRYGSYYRRLRNDQPSVTITNNYIIHPDEDRYLTNREKAVLHTFPIDYKFVGSRESVSQQIANAVPPKFAEKIAKHLLNYF